MKSLILLVCGLISVNALDQALIEEKRTMLAQYGAECFESEKAPPEDIAALKDHKPPVTHEGRCAVFCVSKKLKLMNDDGSVSSSPIGNEWVEKVKANDPEVYGKIQKVHEACSGSSHKGDGCDTAVDLMQCMKTEAQKHGLDKVLAEQS